MQGTSRWMWGFNLLLLWLHGEIFLSLLCSHSSWGSALVFAPPLHVVCPQASVLHPDRRGLKQQLIRTLLLTQAAGREKYGNHNWNARQAYSGRGQYDVATAWGMPCVPPRKLSLDHGTLALEGCTGSGVGRGVDSNLCLHTGFFVAAEAAIAFHAISGIQADSRSSRPSLELT